jgi:hypothetical protein
LPIAETSELAANRYFSKLLTPIVKRLPQAYIAENSNKFLVMFKSFFKFLAKQDHVTGLVVECFNFFCLKLNEEILKPIVVNLTKWATSNNEFLSNRILTIV